MRQIPVCGNDTRPGGHFDQIDVLDAELAARFAGPDAGCWRDAVGSALSPTRRHAPRDVYALEDEPDVKRGPGGLRDLQRARWANACASGRSMPLKPSRLVQAHRFLWQVGVICTCSQVGPKTVSAGRSNLASRACSACRTRADRLRVRCSISFGITPAISSLRSTLHRGHRQGGSRTVTEI